MIKKPLSQLVLQDLHLKLNHKLKDLKTVPIHDFQGFLKIQVEKSRTGKVGEAGA